MTIKHIAMALDAEGLDGPEKLLLIAYCNRTDDHGYCWPGQQRLADDCGTSIATVKRVKKRLVEMELIASVRRLDPKTGEPITNLTRVNLELLASMQRPGRDYDDNIVERITFGADAPRPTKKRKAKKGSDQLMAQDEPGPVDNPETGSDQLMAQDEPYLGLKMSPTPAQDEPYLGLNMSPTPAHVEPLTLTQPSANRQTIRPSVGSTAEAGTDGGTDGEQQQSQTKPQAPVQVPDTAGVQLLQAIGRHRPELMFVGETLRDQGGNVDELLRRGWTVETLWGIITQPLPQRMTKGPAAIISGRLTKALASPVPQAMPAPRDAWDDAEGERWDAPTPTPDRYRAGDDPVSRRWIDCPGRDGLCPNLVQAEGDLCPGCAPQPAAAAF